MLQLTIVGNGRVAGTRRAENSLPDITRRDLIVEAFRDLLLLTQGGVATYVGIDIREELCIDGGFSSRDDRTPHPLRI